MRADEPQPAPDAIAGAASPGHGEPHVSIWLALGLLAVMCVAWVTHNLLTKELVSSGVRPPVIIFLRSSAIVVTLFIWLRATGQQIRLAPSVLGGLLLLSLLSIGQSYAMVFSMVFIPVSLAVLLLYLFPVFTALFSAALGDSRLTTLGLAGAVTAFAGLAIALRIWDLKFNVIGVGLGILAAAAIALNIVVSARYMKKIPRMSVLFYLMTSVMAVSAVFLLASPDPGWPASTGTWTLMGIGIATYVVAMCFFYLAVGLLTPPRASFAMNVEPVATLIGAALLLDETLGVWQYVGAAIVIGAIVAVSWVNLKRGRQTKLAGHD